MHPIINLFWQICLLKKGPQDVSDSIGLYRLAVCCYFIAGLIITKLDANWSTAITHLLISFMLLLGFVWLLLKFNAKLHRFYPTATALFASDALITLASVPVFAAVIFKTQPGVAFLFLVLLMFWNWIVMTNIIRLALSTSIPISFALVLIFNIGSYQLLSLISGGG